MERDDVRQRLFFFIAFAILILLTLSMIQPFFTVLIVSLISVIMLKPVYNFFLGLAFVKGRTALAASLTLLALLVILIIPVLFIARLIIVQLSGLFEQLAALDLEAVLQEIAKSLEELPLVGDLSGESAGTAELMRSLVTAGGQLVADLAIKLGASLPSLMVQGIIFVVVVASLLPVYDTLVPRIEQLSPLGPEISELYNRKITAMVKSLVLGVFLLAVIQGAAMGVFFWIAGLPYIFLLTFLSMLLAMIPMVGISWLVIAIAVIALLAGNYPQAIIVLVGFYGVVNWIDILLRPKLLSKEASLSFALFLLSILGGVAWAGIMGLFYGPVIMLLLVTTIDIYAERYANQDRSALDRVFRNLASEDRAGQNEEQEQPE